MTGLDLILHASYFLFIMNMLIILIDMKSIYLVQPYHVGSKNANSLAVVIPAQVAKTYNISTSTILALRADIKTNTITLNAIEMTDKTQKGVIPTGESFHATSQQISPDP
jgi:hypothetical protein